MKARLPLVVAALAVFVIACGSPTMPSKPLSVAGAPLLLR
jgi:hypothetical protein